MEIINKSMIDGVVESLKPLADEALNYLKQNAGDLISKVTAEVAPVFEGLVKNLTGEMKGIAYGKEVDQLDLATLVKFAKDHIVKDSNEIVVMRMKEADSNFIYIVYSRDRELLPNDVNRYLIIKTKTMAQEVEDLFMDSELIILK